MVNQLRDLMRESSAHAPHDEGDLALVLKTGRRRVRARRARVLGGTALASAAVVAAGFLVWPGSTPPDLAAAGVPKPEGPVLRLTDATAAVEGQDYRVLASYTNEDLNEDNGQYFDGVTDDGLVLFRDGPRMGQLWPRFALMDPATGEKDWLPKVDVQQSQTWPAELSRDRIVLLVPDDTTGDGSSMRLKAVVFDRAEGRWDTLQWSGLPPTDGPWSARVGPDGRLYVLVPATRGAIPEGGWPMGPDGEADDADAEGDTFDLWSVSLTDASDARDEGLRVGAVAFTEDEMVWTDSSNGAAGQVHVRDLATGEERAFDPRTGEKCNLLGFGAAGDRIVMSQYCGTYEDGVRDDRVQVLSTDGDLVTTIQGSGIDGAVASPTGPATITSYEPTRGGTYVYDLDSDRFLRVSEGVSSWGMSGSVLPGQFMWSTPVNRGNGATQLIGELAD